MSKLMEDANGNKSSKRFIAFYGAIVMTAMSIVAVIQDPSTAASLLWPWSVMVTGLLGVTIAEKVK